MLGSLYIITNKITNKSYVGKTYDTVYNRWTQHLSDSKRFPRRKLYASILKHGKENFIIEEIGQYEESLLEELEIKLIAELDSYKNGYNSTLGGDGKRYIEEQPIIEAYNKEKSIIAVSRLLKIDKETIAKILRSNNIKIVQGLQPNRIGPVYSDSLDKYFDSVKDCANYLISSGISKVCYYSTCRGIQRVIDKTRKSYLKHNFVEINA